MKLKKNKKGSVKKYNTGNKKPLKKEKSILKIETKPKIFDNGTNYVEFRGPNNRYKIRLNRKLNRISIKFKNPHFDLETFINQMAKIENELEIQAFKTQMNEDLRTFLEGFGLAPFDKNYPKLLRYELRKQK